MESGTVMIHRAHVTMMVLTVILITAVPVLFLISIWSGDSRWASSGFVVMFSAFSTGSATAILHGIESDR